MTLEELAVVCQEAARALAARGERPVPATVVLPLPQATRVVVLDGFPDDDAARHAALSRFAADEMVPRGAPCFGFVAEAALATDPGAGRGGAQVDVLVVAYGARRRATHVVAAVLDDGGLGAWSPPEELDPAAMPFVRPLQHAADLAEPPPAKTHGTPTLPLLPPPSP